MKKNTIFFLFKVILYCKYKLLLHKQLKFIIYFNSNDFLTKINNIKNYYDSCLIYYNNYEFKNFNRILFNYNYFKIILKKKVS